MNLHERASRHGSLWSFAGGVLWVLVGCGNMEAKVGDSHQIDEELRGRCNRRQDHAAPSVPTGFALTSLECNRAAFFWNASSDSGCAGLAGYRLYRDGALVTTLSSFTTAAEDPALVGGGAHLYAVSAFDSVGNESARSDSLAVSTPACPPPPSSQTETSYDVGVLVIRYFPTTDGVNLDPVETGLTRTLASNRSIVAAATDQGIQDLTRASIYRGFQNSTGVPAMRWRVVDTLEYLTPVPKSILAPPFADHYQILTGHSICDYVENRGVKQVWIWMYHSAAIAPVESHQSGPFGHIGNGGANFEYPACARTYTTLDFNYGNINVHHNYGHQWEKLMKALSDPMYENQFIGPFGTYGSNDGSGDLFHRCGWTHFPPNAASDYDYGNKRFVWTDCEDWRPDGSGRKVYVNCDRWGCNDNGFEVWRWQNMPGYGSNVLFNGEPMRNWWDWMGDFDNAIRSGATLLLRSPPNDTTPPSLPVGFRLAYLNNDKVVLGWSQSVDSGGSQLAGYVIRRNGVVVDRVNEPWFTDRRTVPGTAYTYEVASYDFLMNTSAFVVAVTAQVPAGADATPPSVPTGFTVIQSASTGLSFSWQASVDVGVGMASPAYRVYRDGVFLNYASAPTFWATGLSPSTSYSFQVEAADLAGNVSAKSAPFVFTTPP